nr:isopeptide-forming domain-containing fimbrial protein [Enterococcus sp. 4G2_DIV0659]
METVKAEDFLESLDQDIVDKIKVFQKDTGLLITSKVDQNLELVFPLYFEPRHFGKEVTIKVMSSDEEQELTKVKIKVPKAKKKKAEPELPQLKVDATKNDVTITSYGNEVHANVSDWNQFQVALATPTVTHINILKDINNPDPTASVATSAGMINRSVTIQGVDQIDGSGIPISFAKRQINFGDSGGTRNVKGIELSVVTDPSTLSIKNIEIAGHSSSRNDSSTALIYSKGTESEMWTVKLTDVDTVGNISKRLVYNQNGDVIFDGGTNTLSTSFGTETSYTGTTAGTGFSSWFSLIESKRLTVTNKASIVSHGQNLFYSSVSENSELIVNDQANIDISSQQTPFVLINAANSKIEFTGDKTVGNFSSATRKYEHYGGAMVIEGDNARINVDEKAHLKFHATNRPTILMQSRFGIFNIDNESILDVVQDTDTVNSMGAAIRFRYVGQMTFNIRNKSKLFVEKKDGDERSAAVRMYGDNNVINVDSGSEFEVNNNGTGPAIQYESGSNAEFNLNGKYSTVDIFTTKYSASTSTGNGTAAMAGRAITADNNVTVTAGKDTIFKVKGNTRGPAFRTNTGSGTKTFFEFENMLYYDFKNIGGGTLFFNGGSNSILKSVYSDLSIWPLGDEASFERNPQKAWTLVNLAMSGARGVFDTNITTPFSMDKLQPTLPGPYIMEKEVSDYLNANSNQSISKMGRLSGNNASPIVDELRRPTNADKHIIGHVGIPEGLDGNRDAWTDEVTVEVEVTPKDSSKAPYKLTGKTYGADETNLNGISIYGESPRAGMFKIPNKVNGQIEFLNIGDSVKVIRAWRGGAGDDPNKIHEGNPNDDNADQWVQTAEVTIDVTPPTQTKVSTTLTNATKQLSGTSDEDGAKVFVKVNGTEWLKDANDVLLSTTVTNGEWSLDLPRYLTKEDKVDIYLKDNTTITPLPAYTLPGTYTQEPDGVFGNINVDVDGYDAYLGYHDALKEGTKDERLNSAKRLIVKDVLPDQPSLTKTVVSSGGTTTTVGDILTYTITAGNNKGDSFDTTWKDVEITDIIPEGLVFDPANHGITVNGTPLTDTSKFGYNSETKTLWVKVGDLLSGTGKTPKSVKVTFNAKVDVSAVGKQIFNTAKAAGTTPRETPFVPGINPNPVYEVKDISVKDSGTHTILGALVLKSAPESIDFGKFASNKNNNEIRVDEPTLNGDDLVISDTRNPTKEWELYVRMKEPFKNTDAPTDPAYNLPDAIVYRRGNKETPITGISTQVLSNNNSNQGQVEYNVSAGWTKDGDGIKLRLPAGSVNKLGKYKGVLEFKIQDAK